MFDFLFGKKRTCKRKPTRRRRCGSKRYNVAGSPCNKLKQKQCKSKKGCSYVRRRGCRRSKGFSNWWETGAMPGYTPVSGVSPGGGTMLTDEMKADAHLAATKAANEAARETAMKSGSDSRQIIADARTAGAETVKKYLTERGAPAQDISNFIAEWVNDFNATASAFGQALRRAGFGLGKRFRFGECKEYKDIPTCMNYNEAGMYPCTWLNKSLNRCQKRPNKPVSLAEARATGLYKDYVKEPGSGSILSAIFSGNSAPPPRSSLSDIDDEPPPPPGSAARGIYECIGRTQKMCGGNPNCQWQPGGKGGAGRCIRQKNYLKGVQYEGPMLPGAGFGRRYRFGNTCGQMNNPMMGVPSYGKRRRRRTTKKSKKSKTRKPPAALLKRCKKYRIKTTKKSGRRRVYKSVTELKRLLKKKLKKLKKSKRSKRSRH
jgi:hypothetical protein